MLVGAYAGFVTTLTSGSMWLGVIIGILSGAISSLAMVILNIWLGLNQIVVGLAVTLIGSGLTSVLYLRNHASSSTGLGSPPAFVIPFLSDIPVVGTVIFSQTGVFWVCVVLVVAVAWLLRVTNWGLSLRAAGQKPSALDTAGGSVLRTRIEASLIGGSFAGLGGAYISILTTHAFTPFMTNGLGYIAIVVTMLSRGRIVWVVLTSLLYGLAVAVGTGLQLTSWNIPADVIHMLPFIVIIIILIVFSRSAGVPPAPATPYTRGAR